MFGVGWPLGRRRKKRRRKENTINEEQTVGRIMCNLILSFCQ
jgi:hypothetical protein